MSQNFIYPAGYSGSSGGGGSATAANQVLEIAQLTAINGKLPSTLGQKTSANSLAVVLPSDQTVPVSSTQLPTSLGAKTISNALAVSIASDQTVPVSGSVTVSGTVAATQSGTWNITNISGTVSLPTGASTAALQTTGNTTLSTISGQLPTTLGAKTIANSLAVNIASDQTVPISGTVAATQSGTWNINNVSGTVSLPTGAATSALQTQISGQLPTTLGAKTTANSLAVNIASDQTLNSKVSGKTAVTKVRNDYTSVNVTTSAYVQLIASTSAAVSEIFIFDSSGQTLVLATGAAASEVDQIYIIPGGNGTVPLTIASGTRVSVKAVSATASVGELDINFFG